jgi:site-specific DNA-methyltransferase (adenine-specific)
MTLLLQGDAREVLRAVPDCTVNQIPTSPPYWGQRNYGDDRQIGQEETIEEYLERLWAVFDKAWRVLTGDGTCWINLGDKYLNNCEQLIPERFAIGMVERGWILRGKIVWHKTNPKPESVKSRFSNDWEAIYFFVKSQAHFFQQQFEPYSPETIKRCERFVRNGESYDPTRHKRGDHDPRQAPMLVLQRAVKNLIVPGQAPHGIHVARAYGNGQEVFYKEGRNMRSVWSIPTVGYRGAHFAVWPPRLVARIIRAGCPKGGVVLDPFVGSGATLAVAEEEGCSSIGIDLRKDYLEMAAQRVLAARAKRASPAR